MKYFVADGTAHVQKQLLNSGRLMGAHRALERSSVQFGKRSRQVAEFFKSIRDAACLVADLSWWSK